jgi:2-ketoarginine methyltransferase
MMTLECRLIEALQPARNYFLAQVIEFGLRSGLFERIAAQPGEPVTRLGDDLGYTETRLIGLFRYLAAEGIISDAAAPTLTQRGQEFLQFRSWYELLIGGYGSTLLELPEVLSRPARYASRNGAMVGKGSCGISQYDAIPLVKRLLQQLPAASTTLVDLGCGDGMFLLDLCEAADMPSVGVDSCVPNIERAQKKSVERGLADRVKFVSAPAEEFVQSFSPGGTSPCFIAGFLLHEILEQKGYDAVASLVRAVLAPEGAHLIVIEVNRPGDDCLMQHGLGLAYYNPYYLMHQVTEQRLEVTEFWKSLFAHSGADIKAILTTDPEVDSTGLELGFLLTRSIVSNS